MVRASAQEIDLHHTLYIRTTPYDPDAWHATLRSSNLLSVFPNLVHDLMYGSPIGNPPPLSKIFLPNNLTSANIHPILIDQELLSEVSTSRMSGPFTIAQASDIFGGPFRSSPVGLIEKIAGDGIWCMICHLSKRDEDGQSTNSWIDSDEFPTTYFAASWVCQFVSLFFCPHAWHSYCLCAYICLFACLWMAMVALMLDGHAALCNVRWERCPCCSMSMMLLWSAVMLHLMLCHCIVFYLFYILPCLCCTLTSVVLGKLAGC